MGASKPAPERATNRIWRSCGPSPRVGPGLNVGVNSGHGAWSMTRIRCGASWTGRALVAHGHQLSPPVQANEPAPRSRRIRHQLEAGRRRLRFGAVTGDLQDDLDADLEWGEESDEGERARCEALHQLCEGLVRFRGEAPPAPELQAAAVKLRANLGSKEFPFPQLARALACSGGQPREDTELLIRAVAATVAPLPESYEEELADSGEEDIPLEMDTEELEPEDWLALVTTALTKGPAWLDPERLVQAAGLDPESDDGWIKEGAFVRALSFWEDFGMLDGGRVTQVGRWVLPRALARAWEGDFDHAG